MGVSDSSAGLFTPSGAATGFDPFHWLLCASQSENFASNRTCSCTMCGDSRALLVVTLLESALTAHPAIVHASTRNTYSVKGTRSARLVLVTFPPN